MNTDQKRHWVQAHQATGQPAQARCLTCSWKWEAQEDEDIAHAAAAALHHRHNPNEGIEQ